MDFPNGTPPAPDMSAVPAPPGSADQAKTTLWMGELEPWMDENFIKGVFLSSAGETVNVKVIRDKNSGNAGYCFVEFTSPDAATKALGLNGTPVPNSSRQFKLNWASGGGLVDRRDDRGPEYSIFVGDLGPEVNEYVLVSLFQARFPSCKHDSSININEPWPPRETQATSTLRDIRHARPRQITAMPTFQSNRFRGAGDASKFGMRYRALMNKHPFLTFGLPFMAVIIAGSFVLTPATAIRYERHDRKVRQMTKEEELGVRRSARKVDMREEYYRLAGRDLDDWEQKRVERLPGESDGILR